MAIMDSKWEYSKELCGQRWKKYAKRRGKDNHLEQLEIDKIRDRGDPKSIQVQGTPVFSGDLIMGLLFAILLSPNDSWVELCSLNPKHHVPFSGSNEFTRAYCQILPQTSSVLL